MNKLSAMETFVRIVDKEGAKGLIAKIDKRRAELETPVKAK